MEHELFLKLIQLSGKNQTNIAELLNTKQQAISRWASGKVPPKLSTILQLANKLGYDISFEIKPKY